MLRLAAAATLLAICAPAGAQRLAYADLEATPPRLGYGSVASDELAAPGRAAATRPATAAVREYYLDQMEYVAARGADGYAWDLSAKIGGRRHRLYVGSIGEGTLGGSLDYLEMQALYSRRLSDDWDVQAGLRYDIRPVPNRAWFTVGAQGNATENLFLGAYAFFSHRGELAARVYGLYDIPIAGGLILQPSAEANFFGEDIEALGLGRGLSYGEAGLRLRYELREWFAPYVGVEYERSFGRTARFSRDAGEDVSGRVFLFGLRSWF